MFKVLSIFFYFKEGFSVLIFFVLIDQSEFDIKSPANQCEYRLLWYIAFEKDCRVVLFNIYIWLADSKRQY